ncbi:hypothetical protein HDU98_004035, partial [Podochytrium sp. JEL0797]
MATQPDEDWCSADMKILVDVVRANPTFTPAVIRASNTHLGLFSAATIKKNLTKAKNQLAKNPNWDPVAAGLPMSIGKKRVASAGSSEDENAPPAHHSRHTGAPSTPCPPSSTTHYPALTNTPVSASKVQETSLFNPLDPSVYARARLHQQGEGSNVPLHELFRFAGPDGKLYIVVIFYNVENHSATFCVQPNGMSLLCNIVPQSTNAVSFLDPSLASTSPFNAAITNYFHNPPSEVYKYFVHFPEAVDSNLVKKRVVTQSIHVPGIEITTQRQHIVTVQRPVALVLTFLVSGLNVCATLERLTPAERNAYILMDLIQPPRSTNVLVRNGVMAE